VNTNHFENCSAALCKEGKYQKDAIWYVGEEVCRKGPFTDWQKKQLLLNKKLKMGYKLDLELPFTIALLENRVQKTSHK